MRTLLPAPLPALAAACALIAMPASASAQSTAQDSGAHWWSQSAFSPNHRDRRDRDDRRAREPRAGIGFITSTHLYGGEWARHNNRGWTPDSYNDWWHDRPDRAYPRWTRTNQNCERVWWSGSGWRC